jgi:hypothetical protein
VYGPRDSQVFPIVQLDEMTGVNSDPLVNLLVEDNAGHAGNVDVAIEEQ